MIELNADIGEGGDDAALMPYLARVSIACGAHAGDAASMDAALRLAAAHGVAAGAHPGYPDRAHFGRRVLAARADEIGSWVTRQTEALAEAAARLGIRLAHVKPHGALYNVAAEDAEVAEAIARAVAAIDASLILVGLAGTRLPAAGRAAGLAVLDEGFADRRYRPDGRLVSRETPGAVLSDPAAAAAQAVRLATRQALDTLPAGGVTLDVDTLCLHGDTSGAAHIARAVHAALNYRPSHP
jgi:UPF0271 protein